MSVRMLVRISALTALLSIASASACAQAPSDASPPQKKLCSKELVELSKLEFNIADSSKDASISKEELESRSSSVFSSLDADKSGFLSVEEFRKIPKPLLCKLSPSESALSRKNAADELFAVMDKNGDGKLEREELSSAFRASFASMDKDGDGKLSLSEFLLFRSERKDASAASGGN